MSLSPGAITLLAGAIRYALGECALVAPGELALATPCAEWDLGTLLDHLSESLADLETAIRTGHLDQGRPPERARGDPVELIRERAAALLCTAYDPGRAGAFIAVVGLPMSAGLVTCTGAVEIAVHGWDVAAARAGAGRGESRPVPAGLATRMLRLCPLLVAGREDLFAGPVEVPAEAAPGDRLVGYLGRDPAWGAARRPRDRGAAQPAKPRNSPAGPE